MSRKSEFKENSATKLFNDSLNVKRQKMNENMNLSKSSLTDFDEEKDLSNSVTVYEDANDLTYFNKSSISRVLNSSVGKRSPLATINNDSNNQPGPSGLQQQKKKAVTKTIEMLDDSFFKRLQPKENSPDPFERVCDEILLQIFSYLPKKTLNRVALVNHRFNRIMLDETLWVQIDLGNKPICKGALGKILCRGFIIIRLALAKIQSPIFESDFISEGFECSLQYLDLSMASIDKPSLAQLIGACRSLTKLSLEAVPLNSAVCKQIGKNGCLEVLNLAMCEGLDRDGMVALIPNLPNLSALNISWTHLSSACVLIVMANLTPSIMRFNIAGCRKTMIDNHMKLLSERCPNIVELDISDCNLLTATTVQYVSSFPKLEYLSISRCYNIAASAYLTLNSLPSLLYLDVFGLLSDSGLKSMEKAFKNIGINKFIHSSVARPTVMPRRTSIWGIRTRD